MSMWMLMIAVLPSSISAIRPLRCARSSTSKSYDRSSQIVRRQTPERRNPYRGLFFWRCRHSAKVSFHFFQIVLQRARGEDEMNPRPWPHHHDGEQRIAQRLLPVSGRVKIADKAHYLRPEAHADQVQDEEEKCGGDGTHPQRDKGLRHRKTRPDIGRARKSRNDEENQRPI